MNSGFLKTAIMIRCVSQTYEKFIKCIHVNDNNNETCVVFTAQS